jgi:ribonuclease E
MLIDATHPEEIRVVVLDGTRLDEFDVETSTKKQIKGNIYLAKVVRVEPSLQAAFVDYGGNRHGFLAFGEIHPDYYQIPVADRERLLAEAARHESDEDHYDRDRRPRREAGVQDTSPASDPTAEQPQGAREEPPEAGASTEEANGSGVEAIATEEATGDDRLPLAYIPPAISAPVGLDDTVDEGDDDEPIASTEDIAAPVEASIAGAELTLAVEPVPNAGAEITIPMVETIPSSIVVEGSPASSEPSSSGDAEAAEDKGGGVETVGGEEPDDDEDDDDNNTRRRFVASRHYKIQEVIKRRQIMLVQVVKEERGNKGAALTTYLSLAGRYCVLMPNSARGGGVSRKITSAQDRRRLKSIVGDLDLPKNMAVILRTAGAERSKAEIKRDYEYLQRTWNSIREVTMQSRAPALIHEEASLIKRSIRDIYSRDIEEVWVEGEEGYKIAKDFMRMLTPSHARKVQRYKDDIIPLFHRYQVESQMETINSPVVQLRSGGSIVFAQTEALVAIDVNSGRATRERHIEETAFKTNAEAAEEIARQLRLRDLAGLVVIDFIDMEDARNNHAVERRLKEALKADRARIQVGRISHFGLLELSRQRLRPSLIETNFRVCNHCAGTGLVRSTESAAVHTLRMIEEEGGRRRASELTVTVNPEVALYLLNYKREMLAAIEARYGIKVFVLGDAALIPPNLRIDRVKAVRSAEESEAAPVQKEREVEREPVEAEPAEADEDEDDEPKPQRPAQEHRPQGGQGRPAEEGEGSRRRRRRRRRRRGGEFRGEGQPAAPGPEPQAAVDAGRHEEFGQSGEGAKPDEGEAQVNHGTAPEFNAADQGGGESGRDEQGRRRRRGRRGGRRRRRGSEGGALTPDRGRTDSADGTYVSVPGTDDDLAAPFPPDRTHAPSEEVHLDETAYGPDAPPLQSAAIGPGQHFEPTQSGEPQGERGPARFFRALKEGALGWRRNDAETEATLAPQPPPAAAALPPEPEPEPEPVPPPPPRAPAPEPEPSGPPRRGWWQQSGKS